MILDSEYNKYYDNHWYSSLRPNFKFYSTKFLEDVDSRLRVYYPSNTVSTAPFIRIA